MKNRRAWISLPVILLTIIIAGCTQNNQNNQPDIAVEEAVTTVDPAPSEPTFKSVTNTNADGTGSVNDIDGNEYPIVKIGEQWWMAESLRVTQNPSGEPIEGTCYMNDEDLCLTYGRLYDWDTAMDGSVEEKAQGLCPTGWHIPNDEDWTALFDFLGGIEVAGGPLKAEGTEIWDPPNQDATNSSGFTGLPAGGYFSGAYEGLGVGVHFWSSTESTSRKVSQPTLHRDSGSVFLFVEMKTFYISVRCLMD